MTQARKSKKGSVYKLKVTLCDIKPPIWRRIQVPDDTPLEDLSLMIQAAMGWDNCHLHRFAINDIEYGMVDPDFDDDDDMEDETGIRLNDVVPYAGVSISYLYDFGDGWDHDVIVEDILAKQPKTRYPLCLAGERACPPEDVGGTWGYDEFLKAIRDPDDEEHDRMLEWVGGEFDPETFDVDEANGVLEDYKSLDAERM